MTDTVGAIADAQYVMLTTYRKNGSAVSTPLWAARDGDDLVMWTNAESYKVKRLRRDNRVLVQKCDARGKKTSGPTVGGTGEVIDDPAFAISKIIDKYGIMGRLTVWGSKLRHGQAGTVGIRVRDVV